MRQYLRKYREIVTYLASGFAAMFASWGTYAVCKLFIDVGTVSGMAAAVVLRFLAGATTAYILNRRVVFLSKDENVFAEMVRFFSGRVSTLLMDMGIMWLLPSVFGVNDWVATFVSQVVVTVGNYVIGKFFVFRKKG